MLMLLSKRLYWTCDKFSLLQTPGPWLDNIYISHQNPREAHSSCVEWQQHSSDTDTRQSPGPHVTIITELWRANMGLRTSWSTDSALHSAFCSQVSPAIILITRGAPDGGILQSWLFTSRSRNLVSGKLRSSGFWSYSNFFKWNRVKMAKNG